MASSSRSIRPRFYEGRRKMRRTCSPGFSDRRSNGRRKAPPGSGRGRKTAAGAKKARLLLFGLGGLRLLRGLRPGGLGRLLGLRLAGSAFALGRGGSGSGRGRGRLLELLLLLIALGGLAAE